MRRARRTVAATLVVAVLASAASATAPARAVAGTAGAPAPLVVNGDRASIAEFPYYAAVLDRRRGVTRYDRFFCGGSVVAPTLVLTAGHCTFDDLTTPTPTSAANLTVLVGSGDLLAGDGTEIAVQSIQRYPGYDPRFSNGDDLALLVLSAPTAAPTVDVVPQQSDWRWQRAGSRALVAGLGCQTATSSGTDCRTYPTRLRKASLPLQSDSYCEQRFARYGVTFDGTTMLCAGAPSADHEAGGPCYGDSGGPLVVAGLRGPLLVGLVSWGLVCGGEPAVFTRLATYRTWLSARGVPLAPPAFASGAVYQSVTAATPLVGDYDGNGRADLVLYRPGAASDPLLRAVPGGLQSDGTAPLGTRGRASVCEVDPTNGGRADIMVHVAGAGGDRTLLGQPDGRFRVVAPLDIRGSYAPIAGDFDGDGTCDLFLYRAGSGADYLLLGIGSGRYTGGPAVSVRGTYTPVVGDFDGDGSDDILWYRPGAGADVLWRGVPGRGFTGGWQVAVNGTYLPAAGDFDGDGFDDILWYGPGTRLDVLWRGGAGRFVADTDVSASGLDLPAVGDVNGDGRDDVVWYGLFTGLVRLWYGHA